MREDRETRTFRTIRTIRTRLRQAAPWQAARTTRNSARGQGKLYCSRRGVDGFPRTFPCRSTVPPVLRQFRPASFPPLSESSEKSEGSELSSRPLHRSGGSSVLHPPSLHRSTVMQMVPQHTKKCDSIFTRCRGFSPARGMGRAAPCSFPAAVPSAKGRATQEREPTGKNSTVPPEHRQVHHPPDTKKTQSIRQRRLCVFL